MPETPGKKPIWKNVGTRAITALLFAAICMLPLYFGGWAWVLLVSLLGGRMMWEWVTMSDPAPTKLAFVLPVVGVVVANFYAAQELWSFALITILIAALIAAFERARRGGLMWAGLGYLYIILPCVAIVVLRGMEPGFATEGFTKLIYIISVVVAADVGAYFGGSYFKGPKLAPKLSPNKTWSGFISGLLFGIVMGVIVGFTIGLRFNVALLIVIPIVIFSVLGDLLESSLKRILNVKDAGNLLPGHGGVLDRLDSLMLAVVAATVFLFFVPSIWPL